MKIQNLLQYILISILCNSIINANASDEIISNGGNFHYKGGVEALCKDYEVVIRKENERIQIKNGEAKQKMPTNDDISSTFRILGLAERIGNDRLSKELEKCLK